MIWLCCPMCGRRRLVRPTQQTCSRSCGAVLVKRRWGQAWHQLNGQRAGRIFSQAQADRTIAIWQAMYPGMSVDAIKAIRQQGYQAGWKMGDRNGYRRAVLKRSA
jgi:hypothetical protein